MIYSFTVDYMGFPQKLLLEQSFDKKILKWPWDSSSCNLPKLLPSEERGWVLCCFSSGFAFRDIRTIFFPAPVLGAYCLDFNTDWELVSSNCHEQQMPGREAGGYILICLKSHIWLCSSLAFSNLHNQDELWQSHNESGPASAHGEAALDNRSHDQYCASSFPTFLYSPPGTTARPSHRHTFLA